MSKVSGAVAGPVDQHGAIRALLRAGRNDDAIVKLCAINIAAPNDLVAKELLFDAFFQKRDWTPALILAEELAKSQPGIARLEKALIATLSNMKRYEETIVQAGRYIERHGEDLTMLDALKVAYFTRERSMTPFALGNARSICATPRPAATRRRARWQNRPLLLRGKTSFLFHCGEARPFMPMAP